MSLPDSASPQTVSAPIARRTRQIDRGRNVGAADHRQIFIRSLRHGLCRPLNGCRGIQTSGVPARISSARAMAPRIP